MSWVRCMWVFWIIGSSEGSDVLRLCRGVRSLLGTFLCA